MLKNCAMTSLPVHRTAVLTLLLAMLASSLFPPASAALLEGGSSNNTVTSGAVEEGQGVSPGHTSAGEERAKAEAGEESVYPRMMRVHSMLMTKINDPVHRRLKGLPPDVVPTGKAALAAALASMAKAKKYTKFISLLQFSGWRPIMEQYIRRVPVTLLAPTDAAFAAMLPAQKKQLTNKVVVTKLLQYHMLQQVWPYAALQYFLPSPYPTVLGPYNWKQIPPKGQKTVSFGTLKRSPLATQSRIVFADVSGVHLRLIVVEGINRVIIPPNVFK